MKNASHTDDVERRLTIPRRAITAAVTTSAGLALILSFKTPRATTPRPAPAAVGGPATTLPPSNDRPPPTTRPSTNPPSTSPSGSAPSTTSPAGANKTVDGPVVRSRFGPVQVEVTISGGKITEVTALALPSDRRRSAEISQQAGPILRREALSAQSANIDTVSGATYTSDAYAKSLQAALDNARG
ncbi:MAG: hypothetical protein QOG64_254 [Acidimicrobiaceae bacterium]|nr:hypothetical protein [Acidimicrobiaceae bacterium]